MSTLSAYELSLTATALASYCTAEARRQWQVTKSASLPYNEQQALEDLFRRRPELYTQYQQRALQHDAPVALHPATSPDVGLLSRDEARQELEALAKQYLSLRLVHDEGQALAKAVQARPDLYAAFCQPATTQQDPNPLRQLRRLAQGYVTKRVEPDEQAGMVRAIKEHPRLYEAHRKQVQTPVDVKKVLG